MYRLTYTCRLCRGSFLEPAKTLKNSEVRRVTGKCGLRSLTAPQLCGHDLGTELTNATNDELDAWLGIVQRLGSAWRPWEQSPGEREHQETQRSFGTLLKSAFTGAPGEGAGLLPVVELIRFNTPGAIGVTPRDVDRAWFITHPLTRELLPLDEGESQSVTEVVRKQYEGVRRMRETVLTHSARKGAARVEIANTDRSTKVTEVEH